MDRWGGCLRGRPTVAFRALPVKRPRPAIHAASDAILGRSRGSGLPGHSTFAQPHSAAQTQPDRARLRRIGATGGQRDSPINTGNPGANAQPVGPRVKRALPRSYGPYMPILCACAVVSLRRDPRGIPACNERNKGVGSLDRRLAFVDSIGSDQTDGRQEWPARATGVAGTSSSPSGDDQSARAERGSGAERPGL